jgi:hypothetical protein
VEVKGDGSNPPAVAKKPGVAGGRENRTTTVDGVISVIAS